MSFWNWLIKSLYNKKVIAYSRFRPITSTIWHVLFVVLIASIPFLISMNLAAVAGVNQLQETMDQDLPPFSIKNGILYSDDPSPFLSERDGSFILIDPTNSYSEDELMKSQNGLALLYDKALLFDNGHIQSIPYLILGSEELSRDGVIKRLHDLQGFLPILLAVVTIFMYLGILGVVFLGITFLSFLGLPLRGARKMIGYRHLWVMTAHALTLPVISLYWIDTFFLKVPITIFLIATYVLLLFGVKAIPIPKKRAGE